MWVAFDRTGDPQDDPYIRLAARCGLTGDGARDLGKRIDLSFGFGGGPASYLRSAPEGDETNEATAKRYQLVWRAEHPSTVRFWYALDKAAIGAVRFPGRDFSAGRIAFVYEEPFLRMTLPSGRTISYPFAKINGEDRFGKPLLTFLDNAGGKFVPCRHGHGAWFGMLVENVVQGVARDILAAAMLRLEAAGYFVTLHIHDELVVETPEGFGSVEEFRALVEEVPAWAAGMPIAAKARVGASFAKPGATEAKTAEPVELDEAIETDRVGDDDLDHGRGRDEDLAPVAPEAPSSSRFEGLFADQAVEGEPVAEPVEEPEAPKANGGGNGFDYGPDAAFQHEHHREEPQGEERGRGGNYRDRESEQHAGEPYAPIKVNLLRQGYQVTQSFPYALPGAAEPLYFEDRYELTPGIVPTKKRPRKTSRYRHRVNGQDLSDTGPRRIIFNWPAIMTAGPGATVFVTEGANKSRPLNDAGLLATAVPYHQWGPEAGQALAGRHLIYLEDHVGAGGDDPARKYSADARKNLAGAASFRIVPALHLWKTLGRAGEPRQGWDVKDWLEEGGKAAKLLDICREIPADGVIEAEPYAFPGVDSILPWDWLYGRLLLRGEVTGTAAMGGTGKSSLGIVEALALASGKALLNQQVPRPLRVVLVNLEDTRNTMTKRIAAAMQHYGLVAADIGDRLIVIAKGELKLKVTRQLRSAGNIERNEPAVDALARFAREKGADVLSVDSFIRTHHANENDNSAIQDVVECFEDIAGRANCAVHLWHHTRKSGGEKVTVESARGAGSFIDSCRSIRIMETMSAKEHAQLVQIRSEMAPPGFYFRGYNGKRNFAPPADLSDWYEIRSVPLANGDDIGVVTNWAYPETWDALGPSPISSTAFSPRSMSACPAVSAIRSRGAASARPGPWCRSIARASPNSRAGSSSRRGSGAARSTRRTTSTRRSVGCAKGYPCARCGARERENSPFGA